MRVLVADADAARGKRLAEACIARGHLVDRAPHGPGALELALASVPDLVVCPVDLPIIDGVRLTEILRSNPRTKRVGVIYLVEDELDAPVSIDARDRTLLAPWDEDDLLYEVDEFLGSPARPHEAPPATEIEGKLSQISLVDLLQIFHLNRKSGTVRITREGGTATVHLRDGQVIDASVPAGEVARVVGEKALFRLLEQHEGRFEFLPEMPPGPARIARATRALLLEGARQLDEWEKHRRELPSLDACLRLRAPRGHASEPGLTGEVLDAVSAFRRVGDVVDHCSSPDYQVLSAIRELVARGWLALEAPPPVPDERARPAEGRIFTPTQLRRIRDWLTSQPSRPAALKIVVVPSSAAPLAAFAAALRVCPDFRPQERGATAGPRLLGPLGRFDLGDGAELRLVSLPPDPWCEPLRGVAAHGMLGALVVLGDPWIESLARVEAVTHDLRRSSPRPVLRLALRGGSEPALDERTRAELQRGGPLFVLPQEPGPESAPILHNLFARLAP